MIQHIVMWKLKEELSETKRVQVMQEFQNNMHALRTLLDGILRLDVVIDTLESSNMDILLISEFHDETILKTYQTHVKHKEATKCLQGMVQTRSCVDYEAK